MKKVRAISRITLALAFIVAGANHFHSPDTYISMMPPWLPSPDILVAVSGFAETAGGLGLLPASTRRAAGICLIALLLAVFPANLQIALHGWPGAGIPRWVLFARLPFQIAIIAWVCHASGLFFHPARNRHHGADAER